MDDEETMKYQCQQSFLQTEVNIVVLKEIRIPTTVNEKYADLIL